MRSGWNRINLFIRFLLEIAALMGYGYWGWKMTAGWPRYGLVILFPFSAALAWGLFAVPDDPSRSGKAPVIVPGWFRLLLELAIFGVAAVGWAQAGRPGLGLILAGLALLHYLFSIDRIEWLLGKTDQKTPPA